MQDKSSDRGRQHAWRFSKSWMSFGDTPLAHSPLEYRPMTPSLGPSSYMDWNQCNLPSNSDACLTLSI
eukprot:12890587-Prorocentrum_lima.AAC.1